MFSRSLAFLLALTLAAGAQTPGTFIPGRPLPAQQLNQALAGKLDYPMSALALTYVNPVQFGADPTCANNSDDALDHALAASNNVQFPAGCFKFSRNHTYAFPVGTSGVRIAGSGAELTTLLFPFGNGITIDWGANNGYTAAVIENLSGLTSQAGVGTFITYTAASPAFSAQGIPSASLIRNVTCRGSDGFGIDFYWDNCALINNVSNVIFDNIYFVGNSGLPYQPGLVPNYKGVGVFLKGTGPIGVQPSVIYNFSKVQINALAAGIIMGDNIQGVTVSPGSNFTANNIAIWAPPGATGFLSQLSVTGSQFGNKIGGKSIYIQSCVSPVLISGNNQFIVQSNMDPSINAVGVGVDLECYDQSTITGNQFTAPTGGVGIIVGPNHSPFPGTLGQTIINGNTVFNFGAFASIGIWLQAGTDATIIVNNEIWNAATAIKNDTLGVAVHNIIAGNLGYNPVGTAGLAITSGVPVVAGPTPETHYLNQNGTQNGVCSKNAAVILTTVNASTFYQIDLGPNESYTCTFSGTPIGVIRDVH